MSTVLRFVFCFQLPLPLQQLNLKYLLQDAASGGVTAAQLFGGHALWGHLPAKHPSPRGSGGVGKETRSLGTSF